MATATIGTTVDEVLALVDELGQIRYGATDLRTHALRCASLAMHHGSDDALTAACLLHDVGRVRYLARLAPGVPHEEVGRRFVADRFGERAAWLVGQHVIAKRYLATVDAAYLSGLPRPSQSALKRQGGPLDRSAVAAFEQHPWAADAVLLRRFDDRAAVDNDLPVAEVEAVADVLGRCWVR